MQSPSCNMHLQNGFPHCFIRFLSAALLPFVSCISVAQDSETELDPRYKNWYQIELIVFERRHGSSSPDMERWSNSVELNYPLASDFLYSEDAWKAATAPIEDEQFSASEEEANLNTDELATQAERQAQVSSDTVNPETAAVINAKRSSADLEPSSLEEEDQMEIERILLKDDERALNSEEKKLARRGLHILFHEAWRQELHNSKRSLPVVITGGREFDQHYELEGNIKISLNRYLHIDTDLWRTTFVPNYGQEIPYWPALPKRPVPAPIIDDAMDVDNEGQSALITGSLNTLSRQENAPFNEYKASSFNLDLNTRGAEANDYTRALSLDGLSLNQDKEELKTHLVSEIITLKQTRRMRSDELHYIDHPRLGLLVKITPYEKPLTPKIEEVDVNALGSGDILDEAQ